VQPTKPKVKKITFESLFRKNQFEKVVQLTQKEIKKDPENMQAQLYQMMSLMVLNDKPSALKILHDITQDPQALIPTICFIVETYQDKSDIDLESTLQDLLLWCSELKLDDKTGDVDAAKAYTYMIRQNQEDAEKYLKLSLQKNPKNPLTHYLQGLSQVYLDPEEAEKSFDEARKNLKECNLENLMGVLTQQMGIAASAFVKRVKAEDAETDQDGMPVIATFLMSGELGEAITNDDAEEMVPGPSCIEKNLIFHKIAARICAENMKGAIALLNKVITLYPKMRMLKSSRVALFKELGFEQDAEKLEKELE
jgi:tetratricopeptide (TPR) repeat protein